MGRGWWVPARVLGQPRHGHVAPWESRAGGRRVGSATRAARLPRAPLVPRPVVTFAMD